MMEDQIVIPPEEKEQVKAQFLANLRRQYLQYKGEYIISLELKKSKRSDEFSKLMDENVRAYARVEADL